MESKQERDYIIDFILSRMEYGIEYSFASLFEDHFLHQFKGSPELVAKFINARANPEGNLVNALLKSMNLEGLIEINNSAVYSKRSIAIVKLTLKGQDIKEDGGWLIHLSNKKEMQMPKPDKHHWSGIGANIATIGGFLLAIYSVYTSFLLDDKKSKIEALEKELQILKTDSAKTHQMIQMLKNKKPDSITH